MRKATKTPSEWLRLLCRDWSLENESIVAATDSRFIAYKSYLKGQLTSQLLCRLSVSGNDRKPNEHTSSLEAGAVPALPQLNIDFWKILGVEDDFDRAHIVANIERFCSLYNIRGGIMDELPPSSGLNDHAAAMIGNYYPDAMQHQGIDPAASAAAAGMAVGMPSCAALLYPDLNDINSASIIAKAQQPMGAAKIRQAAMKSQERRLKAEMREREREAYSIRKAAEKAARLAKREERRQRKIAMRRQREELAQRQKEAALRRAAELVQSNRVPIEITRGAAAAQAAANAAVASAAIPAAVAIVPPLANTPAPAKKGRSSIVISTASDLDQIVTHSNNLWAKYNAIAKEHNQKVNWIVVAKELGIHVKVREKYARMHARAKARGFDFVNWGHYRIKDYPQYFLDPLGSVSVPLLAPAKIEELSGKQPPMEAGSQDQHQQHLQPGTQTGAISSNPMSDAMKDAMHDAQERPNLDMMMLAAEAAGVVGDAPTYSNDPAMVVAAVAAAASNNPARVVAAVAAAAVQQHQLNQPEDVLGDQTHVVPPLPQGGDSPMNEMKSAYEPLLGDTESV
mmetsp:Transcript_43397/g.74061  ORF Transcript_43397/g.74061 Transcript_43397/m.74061 type:complete len:568 (+) Transcript_43397:156-1859(+)